jgi:hypothetical protein
MHAVVRGGLVLLLLTASASAVPNPLSTLTVNAPETTAAPTAVTQRSGDDIDASRLSLDALNAKQGALKALDFTAYFWIELHPAVNSLEVFSDIRHRICDRLAEAGIAIPFPQWDLHLEADKPLEVRMVNP